MFRSLLKLVRPYNGQYRRFIAGVVLRQALVVIGGYSLVWALRVGLQHTAIPEWIFVAGFILFDAAFMSFDLKLNFYFLSRISYPLFAGLRMKALEKTMQMPMEWHQRQSSGELVGKVNNGQQI
jgi:ABC-type multidrug transport system fused ATPase/permease subunit